MDSFEEIKSISLKDGNQIVLDDEAFTISLKSKGECISSVKLNYPTAGYAGGAIHVSVSESIILFAYYSGQSEEAYTLLRLGGKEIEVVFESDYFWGEAASYCFSADESKLIQALPRRCSKWWLPWEDEDMDEDDFGNQYFDFGSINIQDVETGSLVEHEIRIQPSMDWEPKGTEYEALLLPEMLSENTIRISWPWGEEVLKLPLPSILVYKASNESM